MSRLPTPVPTAFTRSYRPLFASLVLFFLAFTVAPQAHAYPWMLRHGYGGCGTCHVDPSGGGVLEPYGGYLAQEVLRSDYGGSGGVDHNTGAFLAGSVSLPDALRLKGDVRVLSYTSKVEDRPLDQRLIWMQADMAAAVELQHFVASASLGYLPEGGEFAALTRGDKHNLVSRYHWLGFWDDSHSFLVRAGRMALPFGVRTIEHTLWVRDLSHTSINDDQTYGVSTFFTTDRLRTELMLLAGNFQVRPDDYRERGYSGYLEVLVTPRLALGASSLAAHKELDPVSLDKTWRQSHGATLRWATPYKPLVVASEVDWLLFSSKGSEHREGWAGYLQADLELLQGIHVIATGEANNVGLDGTPMSYAGWLSYQWFFAPHADVRLDNIYYRLASPSITTHAFVMLTQLHVYL